MRPRTRCGLASLVALALLDTGTAGAQEVSASASVSYSGGTYIFTDHISTIAVTPSLALRLGRLHASVAMPVITQNATAVTWVAGTYVPTGGPGAIDVAGRRPGQKIPVPPDGGSGGHHGGGGGGSGGTGRWVGGYPIWYQSAGDTGATAIASDVYRTTVGDPTLSVSVDVLRTGGVLRAAFVRVAGKAPVAPLSSGIGTGAWDYGGGLGAVLGGDRTVLFAGLDYWVLGDLPDLALQETVHASASLSRLLGERGQWSLGASIAGSGAIVATADPPLSAGVSVGWVPSVGPAWSLGASAGLSESSPGYAVHLAATMPIRRGMR